MIPLQPMERTRVKQVVPATHREYHTKADKPHCSLCRTPCRSRWMFPEGTVACGEPMLEQIFPTSTTVCGGPTLEQTEGLQPVGRADTGAGEQHVEKGAAERICYRLTTTPHSPSPCAAWGGVR